MSILPAFNHINNILAAAGYTVNPENANVVSTPSRTVYTAMEGNADFSLEETNFITHGLPLVVIMNSKPETSPDILTEAQVLGEMYSDIIKLIVNQGGFRNQETTSGTNLVELVSAQASFKTTQKGMGAARAVFTLNYREPLL